jgi:hypothetical protein
MAETKAILRISRVQGREKNHYKIAVTDQSSHVNIASLHLNAEQFAEALSNVLVSDIDCTSKVLDDRIGKGKKVERRKVIHPGTYYNREWLKTWLIDTVGPQTELEGKHLDTYIGSQDSVVYCNGDTVINNWVYWWE